MAAESDNEDKLKQCIKRIIDVIEETIKELQPSLISEENTASINALLNNTNTFTLNIEDEKVMEKLKMTIENLLDNYRPRLTERYRNYLSNFLYSFGYDYEKQEFKNNLTISVLLPLRRSLQGILASVDVFRDVRKGKLPPVKAFLEKYSSLKDKPGLWGTTLLYSATENGHIHIVKYLIEEAKCSVNARNEQHREGQEASVALHGACSTGHLEIVQYLVEHGANYFLKDESFQTPLSKIRSPDVKKYFQEYLLLGYPEPLDSLPNKPIMAETRPTKNSVWEYKPFSDDKWYDFSSNESDELQRSLVIPLDQQFRCEVHLKVVRGIYSISVTQFLRSGRNLDTSNNLAWVRCRGSSILNFDCYSFWQMMFIAYPKANPNPNSSLDIFEMPTASNSTSTIQLNCWYNCDTNSNAQLDDAMNIRQKILRLKLDSINTENVLFNLQTFSFENETETIKGCLRWLPKLISNSSRNEKKLKYIDNYSIMTNLNPIPLTTERYQRVTEAEDTSSLRNSAVFDDESETVPESPIFTNELDGEDEDDDNNRHTLDEAKREADNRTWAINDDASDEDDVTSTDLSVTSDGREDASLDDYLDSQDEIVIPESRTVTASDSSAAILEDLRKELEQVKADRDREQEKANQEIKSTAQSSVKLKEKLNQSNNELQQLNEQLEALKREEEKIKKLLSTIDTKQYTHIPNDIVVDFFTPKHKSIHDYLQRQAKKLDDCLLDRIPKTTFEKNGPTYTLTLTGVKDHHQGFKKLYERILTLLYLKDRAIQFYQRHLKRQTKKINQLLFKVKPSTKHWKHFSKLFYGLLRAESAQYLEKFKDFLTRKILKLCETFLSGQTTSPRAEIRKKTDDFLQRNPFLDEIEPLKQQALEKFIETNVSFQRMKLPQKPSKKSIETVQYFVENIKRILQDNREYHGQTLAHFTLMASLLQRLMIYYSCFTIQLPLYDSSKNLLKTIRQNTVVTISTSTGSGKSTLLPALLIADGYNKVIVTQPRRLPCKTVSQRVNETMAGDAKSSNEQLAGWAFSGAEQNPKAKILYLTDGLLKERLLSDERFITTQTNGDKSIVIFLDEVHERSVNIDLCLALIARMLTQTPAIASKLKVIISSATLDSSVPKLFQGIQGLKFASFTLPSLGTRYPVRDFERPNANLIDIVLDLYKKRERLDQILCFVNSGNEVNQCCYLLNKISQNAINAYPLLAAQSSRDQQEAIEKGTVFISTTIAETSLTFPSLKYVVDTGVINIPVYDLESQRTILKEIHASESTIKQRRGRLGRTQPGEYYSLYDSNIKRKPFPEPQISQSDLISIEFSLRKSPLQKGLEYMKQFLPKEPQREAIFFTIQRLNEMDILASDSSDRLTKYGTALAKLPDFGSLAMTRSVYAALVRYKCGGDLIRLASILSVLNTTAILKPLPQRVKSPDGDFMTLLNVMNEVLLERQSRQGANFNSDRFCQNNGFGRVKHLIAQALRRYTVLENLFEFPNEHRQQAQIQSKDWELIAKALLFGHSDNVFVSKKDLQERTHHFIRYNDTTDTAVLDHQSTLRQDIRQTPVSIVVARDILYLSAIRSTAVISFLGKIKTDWIEHHIERDIKLSEPEETRLKTTNAYSTVRSTAPAGTTVQLLGQILTLKGPAGVVLRNELHLLQSLIIEEKFPLENTHRPNTAFHQNLAYNLESVMDMTHIFNPMIYRWDAQHQVKITVRGNKASKTCDVTVRGKHSQIQRVKEEFDAFSGWLKYCAVIRHPNDGVSPRLLRPHVRKTCEDIEERISHVTDPKRTRVDLYNNVKGPKATRETRMEVVAWIAVCLFDCKLEGGFVRDWIVGKDIGRPKNLAPIDWIVYKTNDQNQSIPSMHKEVVPADLDCHLPRLTYFDIERFLDELHKFDIKCRCFPDRWRYILLIDEHTRTGPFTMDLIEPHVALAQDRIDFDVSNLVLEKNYTRDIGMRIDIQRSPYGIELETIIDNIKHKRFRILRPIDRWVEERVEKMEQSRHWTQFGEPFNVNPKPHFKNNAVLVSVHNTSSLYKTLAEEMSRIPNCTIISIEEISNPYVEEMYEGMKKVIATECVKKVPNERHLFHGTSGDGIEGIIKYGFDDRFFNPDGAWGHGAYFADDARKSHKYAPPTGENGNRVMFYNKVALGNQSELANSDNSLKSAPQGYHSVKGTQFAFVEYIVYRYGQALPHFKITYRAP